MGLEREIKRCLSFREPQELVIRFFLHQPYARHEKGKPLAITFAHGKCYGTVEKAG